MLDKLVRDIEWFADFYNPHNIINPFDWSRLPEIFTWTKTRYYSCLIGAAAALKPKRILEIGTFTGASALCLATTGVPVDTYDIEDKIFDPKIKEKINFNILRKPEDCTNLTFNNYDLIFIDIGMHDGIFEEIIQEKLNKTFKGVVLWDDIDYNWRMKKLWDSINQPKIKTDWHPVDGFGVVKYD